LLISKDAHGPLVGDGFGDALEREVAERLPVADD